MTTTDSAASRTRVTAAARCASIARKALSTLGLIAAGFAGLITAEWVLSVITSFGIRPGEWRQIVLHALGALIALVTFWIAYGFPRDMWRFWRDSKERKRTARDESA